MSTLRPAVDRAAILERQAARESGARTYARWLDVVPVRGHGMEIEAADGRTYLDALSGAGALALGHDHPVPRAAIEGALAAGRPMQLLDAASPERDAFTTALLDSLPAGLRARDPRVQFCSPSGADAVEAAVKLCQTATGRRGVLACTGGYHGMTLAALQLTGATAPGLAVTGGGLPVTRIPFPAPYRCPFGTGDRGALAAAYLERLLDDASGGVEPPAMLLVEPVQGEGGIHPAPHAWLREVRRITAERGIALAVDEVQAGVGRTGSMWAHEQAGIVPDAMVVSKAVGGGLPLAAVVYAGELDAWAPGAHAGTFRGTTLALAAGAATLEHVRAEGLAARAAALGEGLLTTLRAAAGSRPQIGDVRGRGLMAGVELVDPGKPARRARHPPGVARARRGRTRSLPGGRVDRRARRPGRHRAATAATARRDRGAAHDGRRDRHRRRRHRERAGLRMSVAFADDERALTALLAAAVEALAAGRDARGGPCRLLHPTPRATCCVAPPARRSPPRGWAMPTPCTD
ncbi:MAG: aminotransferase class III-fold pyridoxal phosphate-dependent enzyme [Patulibacter minatonensis]